MSIENEINNTERKYQQTFQKLSEYKIQDKEVIPLTPANLELIHNEMIAQYGGSLGIRDNNLSQIL